MRSSKITRLRPESLSNSSPLEETLRDREGREEVVQRLLSLHAPLEKVLQVRFISAVLDFETTYDVSEKLQRARSIVEVFIRNDSRYRLANLPPNLQRELKRSSNMGARLSGLKADYLRSLNEDPQIVEALASIDYQCSSRPAYWMAPCGGESLRTSKMCAHGCMLS